MTCSSLSLSFVKSFSADCYWKIGNCCHYVLLFRHLRWLGVWVSAVRIASRGRGFACFHGLFGCLSLVGGHLRRGCCLHLRHRSLSLCCGVRRSTDGLEHLLPSIAGKGLKSGASSSSQFQCHPLLEHNGPPKSRAEKSQEILVLDIGCFCKTHLVRKLEEAPILFEWQTIGLPLSLLERVVNHPWVLPWCSQWPKYPLLCRKGGGLRPIVAQVIDTI